MIASDIMASLPTDDARCASDPSSLSHSQTASTPLPQTNLISQTQPHVDASTYPSTSSLVERTPRMRGGIHPERMDVLKSWAHRHADHLYATEQEKREMVNATGLSLSQVSNWLIGARCQLRGRYLARQSRLVNSQNHQPLTLLNGGASVPRLDFRDDHPSGESSPSNDTLNERPVPQGSSDIGGKS
ncbi:hypothetical protein DL96DRAFT_1587661 [Flagelloscypha sp. PMI_526]|nr:hypothetical protein DL96DRAFT_1587661 [Flagelloscypha sp. PMI_526]